MGSNRDCPMKILTTGACALVRWGSALEVAASHSGFAWELRFDDVASLIT